MKKIVWATLLGLLMGCSQDQSTTTNRINLTDLGPANWQGDVGEWFIAGDVFPDPESSNLLATKDGDGILVNGKTGRTNHLVTKQEFGDVKAHIEFLLAENSNSGVYFAGQYEIQIIDSYKKEMGYPGNVCGGIYQRWDENREPKGFEGRDPLVDAAKPIGEWQTYDVIFRAAQYDDNGTKIKNAMFEKVLHNGQLVHENQEVTGPTRASLITVEQANGPLMLQGDHGPVAYRNVWIEPIK